jgi:hypothetical protein
MIKTLSNEVFYLLDIMHVVHWKSTVKFKADFQQVTQRFIPEARTAHNHQPENLKGYLRQEVHKARIWLNFVYYIAVI